MPRLWEKNRVFYYLLMHSIIIMRQCTILLTWSEHTNCPFIFLAIQERGKPGMFIMGDVQITQVNQYFLKLQTFRDNYEGEEGLV
jgi:hypothetical protein